MDTYWCLLYLPNKVEFAKVLGDFFFCNEKEDIPKTLKDFKKIAEKKMN